MAMSGCFVDGERIERVSPVHQSGEPAATTHTNIRLTTTTTTNWVAANMPPESATPKVIAASSKRNVQ